MTVTKHAGQVSGFPDADGYYCIEYILPGGVQTVSLCWLFIVF